MPAPGTLVQRDRGAQRKAIFSIPTRSLLTTADYLQHFDLAESVKNTLSSRTPTARSGLDVKIRAKGTARRKDGLLDVTSGAEGMRTRRLKRLVLRISSRPTGSSSNGWLGPPWLKEGWFQSYLLLAGTVADAETKRTVESIYLRLVTGGYDSTVERLNLERRLVSSHHA